MIQGFVAGFIDRDTQDSVVLISGRFVRNEEQLVGYGLFIDGRCREVLATADEGRREVVKRARAYASAHRIIDAVQHGSGRLVITQASQYRFSFKSEQE